MDFLTDLQNQLISYYDTIIDVIPKLGIALVIVILYLIVISFIRKRFVRFMRKKAEDVLLVDFFNKILRSINIIIAILLFLYIIGLAGLAGSALGGLGISAVVVGFAFKDIAENFLAGVIMAFKRPFRVGDTVESVGIVGSVIGMNLRETHLKTFDGKDVYIPNGQILKNPLYNFTIDGFMRSQFIIGVDYDTDLPFVRKLIVDTIDDIDGIIKEEKPPRTIVSEFGTSTINITVQYWIDTFDKKHSSVELQSKAMNNVLRAIENNNINLPGDVLEIKNYRNGALQTGAN